MDSVSGPFDIFFNSMAADDLPLMPLDSSVDSFPNFDSSGEFPQQFDFPFLNDNVVGVKQNNNNDSLPTSSNESVSSSYNDTDGYNSSCSSSLSSPPATPVEFEYVQRHSCEYPLNQVHVESKPFISVESEFAFTQQSVINPNPQYAADNNNAELPQSLYNNQQQPQQQQQNDTDNCTIVDRSEPTIKRRKGRPTSKSANAKVKAEPKSKTSRKRKSESPIEPDSNDAFNSDVSDDDQSVDSSRSSNGNSSRLSHELGDEVVKSLLEEADQKRRRLARKAELARLSRKRKKTRIVDLEGQVDRLKAELTKVQNQLEEEKTKNAKQGISRNQSTMQTNTLLTNNMQGNNNNNGTIDPLTSGLPLADDGETGVLQQSIQSLCRMVFVKQCSAEQSRSLSIEEELSLNDKNNKELTRLIENFVLIHKRQENLANIHLQSVSHLLTPSMPLQFLSWLMNQQESFYDISINNQRNNSNEQQTLWQQLMLSELNMSSEQMNEMNALKTTMKKQHKFQSDVQKAFKRLNHSLTKHCHQWNENLDRLRAILTNDQLMTYVDFVNRFGAVLIKIKTNEPTK